MPISDFAIALVLTEVIELTVAWMLKYRQRHELIVIFLVNLATNPLANFIVLFVYNLGLLKINLIFLLAVEAFVVAAETLLLSHALEKKPKEVFMLALAMNAFSFAAGVLLNPKILAL
ncbi:MAG: hypothetical protein N3F05_02915 [Candidatus Diapherotrites archaeon]|nr:hypothetical protein [Candidatus Diapherotrites archaeon]